MVRRHCRSPERARSLCHCPADLGHGEGKHPPLSGRSLGRGIYDPGHGCRGLRYGQDQARLKGHRSPRSPAGHGGVPTESPTRAR